MRPIKFRAWDKINKRMIDHKDIGVLLKNVGSNNQFIYMQSTGLKDKNGKESYHKDKCRYKDLAGNQQVGIIEWSDVRGWYLEAIGGDDEGNQDVQLADGPFEIFGTIHDKEASG